MRKFLIFLYTVWSVLLTACGPGAQDDTGSILRVLKSKKYESLDPACVVGMESVEIVTQLYETLLRISPAGEIVPHLAHSVNTTDDIHWNIILRKGIRFHDGELLDAKAVVETFRRQMRAVANPNSQSRTSSCTYAYWKAYFSIVDSVEARGDYTVVVTLKKPYPLFRYNLTLFPVSIVSPAASRRGNLAEHPVGTGPYRFLKKEDDGSVLLERFDHYWNRSALPKFRYLRFEVVPSEKRRLLALRGGAGDIVMDFNYQNLAALSLHPGISVSKSPGTAIVYLAFNTLRPPMGNRTNRLAVAYAIQRSRIVDYVFQGNAEVLDCPFPCNMKVEGVRVLPGKMIRDLPWMHYSPDDARALLKDSGLLERRDPILFYVVDKPRAYLPAPVLMANMIATSLRQAGLRVRIVSLPYKQFKQAVKEGKHDIAVHGWIPDYPAPSTFLYPLLYTRVRDGRPEYNPSFNLANFFDSEFNRALDKALMVNSVEQRINHYREAVKVFWRDVPWIPMAVVRYVVLHSSRVTNVRAAAMGMIDYSKARPVRNR